MEPAICLHLLTLGSERVRGAIKKGPNCCTNNSDHDGDLSLCLNCGNYFCDRACLHNHCSSIDHCLYTIRPHDVFCMLCQSPVSHMQQSNTCEQNARASNIYSKIISYLNKYDKKSPKMSLLAKQEKPIQPKRSSPNTVSLANPLTARNHKKPQQLPTLKVFGLSNLGNTCFMNSTLQCLYASGLLSKGLQLPDISPDLLTVFERFLTPADKVVSAKSMFYEACQLRPIYKTHEQQDAQQFYHTLINGVIESEKRIKGQSIVEGVYGFQLARRLFCYNCHCLDWQTQSAVDLCIELGSQTGKGQKRKVDPCVPQGLPIEDSDSQSSELVYPAQKDIPNSAFLEPFFSTEALNRSGHKCQKCGSKNSARKYFIKKSPKSLVVVFKRFNNNGSKNNGGLMRISEQLSVDNFSLQKFPPSFQLYGVVVHLGTARAGHYIAYTRRDQSWFMFSDKDHKQVSWEKVAQAQPYMAFYRQK